MNSRVVTFTFLSVTIVCVWIAGADWFFDSSTEDLMFRHHNDFQAVIEEIAMSLYTIPFVGQLIFDGMFSDSTRIDRGPLFIISFIQIIVLLALIGLAMRGVGLWRNLLIGYGATMICTSFAGFLALHFWLRPLVDNCCP